MRITHWLNALAVVVMVTSGWQIYNASPLFGFEFPKAITLGGWLAGGIQWHFAAMWLLAFNGLVYLLLNIASGRLEIPARRIFLGRSLTLGGLSLLAGCGISDNKTLEAALQRISRFNDRAQAWLFDPDQLAPIYPESMITRPFPFNAYYSESETPVVDEAGYSLELGGLIADKKKLTLAELRAMPQRSQITRHICVEGWSAIGKWGGVLFSDFLKRIGADTTAKYVGFRCADDYYQSIDMATALHAQTLLALTWDDQPLPPKYGFPMKLRMPTKLGYKNPKLITTIFVTNEYPGGYWEDQGYNWFGGS